MPLQITVTSKHRQCDCQHSSQLLCAPGNLFQPWPTPPQPTPSDGGHKAQAPRQPCWLVTSRDPVTIIMTSDWHRIEIFETETKWKKYENMCFGMLWSNCTDQKRTYQAISNGPWTPSCRFSKVKSFTASFHAALFRIPSHSTHVHTLKQATREGWFLHLVSAVVLWTWQKIEPSISSFFTSSWPQSEGELELTKRTNDTGFHI